MSDLINNIFNSFNLFDLFFSLILFYSVIQCFLKGFSLSLISFMKWILSTIVTIILVPKFQPVISNYIESEFINNVGLGAAIFIFTLFSLDVFHLWPPIWAHMGPYGSVWTRIWLYIDLIMIYTLFYSVLYGFRWFYTWILRFSTYLEN